MIAMDLVFRMGRKCKFALHVKGRARKSDHAEDLSFITHVDRVKVLANLIRIPAANAMVVVLGKIRFL